MSVLIDELKASAGFYLDSSGSLEQRVKLDLAVAALDTQKRAMISVFKSLLAKIVLAQALGRHEDWTAILDNMMKDI